MIFDTLSKQLPEVPFKKEWENGTGYFDGAYKDASITSACKSTDPYGRTLILIPYRDRGRHAVMVWSQRYSDRTYPLVLGGAPRFMVCGVFSENYTDQAAKSEEMIMLAAATKDDVRDEDLDLVLTHYMERACVPHENKERLFKEFRSSF